LRPIKKKQEHRGIKLEEIIEFIIGAIIMFFFFFIMPQLLILNGLRYLKYKKIIDYRVDDFGLFPLRDKESVDGYLRNRAKLLIAFGTFFNIFFYFFLLLSATHGYPWIMIIFIFLLLATIYFFYWYWHTKEDPLGDFEFRL
jgi:Ca2+/Na+ antiporter